MSFAETLNTATPANDDSPSEADDRMRETKAAFVERLDVDHYFAASGANTYNDDDTGEHRRVTIRTLSAAEIAALEATKAYLYRSETDGELYFKDDDDNTLKLTVGGQFNIASGTIPDDSVTQAMIRLANNANLVALNAAGDAEISLIKANASDTPEIPDGAVLATSAAPTVDAGIANKKYVDDSVAATVQASGATVFNTHCSASGTWQDLDLSAQVGANVAMVYLEVTGAAGIYVAVKPKGYGSATFTNHTSSGDQGASQCYLGSKYSYLVCMTDSSGVIQIGATSGGNAAFAFTVKLIGFVR